MKIHCQLKDIGYRYGRNRLFSQLKGELDSGQIHIITGPNGSGKSTLLRLLSSALDPEEGTIHYFLDHQEIGEDQLRKHISFFAPYQELPEEFSLAELISLQKQFISSITDDAFYHQLVTYFGLLQAIEKPVGEYSTGMKQKAKFILALGMNRPIWLLDEPGANLDVESCSLLHQLLRENCQKRLVIIASNDPAEIALGKTAFHL